MSAFPNRRIPAKAALRRPIALPEYLPARMLNEFVYCPRLFFYEWVEGVFAHSADTVEGSLRHEKLGEKAEAMAAPGSGEDERIHARSVTLTSDAHAVIATIDLVEGDGDCVVPVDYKHGAPREYEGTLDAWPADRAQVCVQALILRSNGYRCDEAIVYYNATKQRVRVAIDDALAAETLDGLNRARLVASAGVLPPPLVDSPKCPRCSLVAICLPDETRAAMAWRDPETDSATQLGLFESSEREVAPIVGDEEVRRLIPARDDLRPLYITGYNFIVGKSKDVLQVREKGQLVQEVRIREVSQVNVFGNVSLTAGAVQALCESERPIAYFSFGGWFYGLTQGLGLKNVFLRQEQFRRAGDETFCLSVAREIVASKIRNQRTLLQRNHVEPPARAIEALRRLARQAIEAGRLETLLGLEGTAAHYCFANLAGMLKVEDEAEQPAFDFTHRTRRPPRDPVNALALDLMEGFRPLIVDSAVITAINTRMVTRDDFIQVGPSMALTAKGRKRFITAYEQRMDALVTHPMFGYRVNYRRVLEIQARLLARVVTGELSRYAGFETR